MKYFFSKVSLSILSAALKDVDFTEDKVFKALYSKKIETTVQEYKNIKNEL